jgi:hypothetical protein
VFNLSGMFVTNFGVELRMNNVRTQPGGAFTNKYVLPGSPYSIAISDDTGFGFNNRPLSKKVTDIAYGEFTIAVDTVVTGTGFTGLGNVTFSGGIDTSKCFPVVTSTMGNTPGFNVILVAHTFGSQSYRVSAMTNGISQTIPAGTIIRVGIIGMEV